MSLKNIPHPKGPSPFQAPLWIRIAKKWKATVVPEIRFKKMLDNDDFKHKTKHYMEYGYDKDFYESTYDRYKDDLTEAYSTHLLDALEHGNDKAVSNIINKELHGIPVDDMADFFNSNLILAYLERMAKRGIMNKDYKNMKVLIYRGAEQDLDADEAYGLFLNEMLTYPGHQAFPYAYGIYLWLKVTGLTSKGTDQSLLRDLLSLTLDGITEVKNKPKSKNWETVLDVLYAICEKIAKLL